MIIRAFKKFREFCKKEKELNYAMHRLATLPMDYQTIQTICNAVSSGYNVEVFVKQPDGTEVTIRRTTPQSQIEYKSFAQKYAEAHQ